MTHKLHRKYAGREPVRVFYEISTEPLYTIGGTRIISRVIELCGGRNIFAELTAPAAAVSTESVLARATPRILQGGQQLCEDLEKAREHHKATTSHASVR